MHLLQCCNVGDVLGGTGACAWSLARGLKECRNTIAFFGAVTEETRRVCREWDVVELGRLEGRDVRRLGVDAVVLHNTPGARVLGPLPVVTLLYCHSYFRGAYEADGVMYCSRWLARRYGVDERLVCYQGVAGAGCRAIGCTHGTAGQASSGTHRCGVHEGLVVGRLCSPQGRKWPREVVEFYRVLAGRLPRVGWEFVGCPLELQGRLQDACRGKARFHRAGWEARERLRKWDVWCYSNPSLSESFGRVCAEAMRAGCVPVADRLGGFVEQVEDGKSGFLCTGVEEFGAALEELQGRETLERMGAAAKRRGDAMFGLEGFGQRVLEWLEAVARGCVEASGVGGEMIG